MKREEAEVVVRSETEEHYKRAVSRVIGAMKGHLDLDFPLEQMAEVAYMSPFHLNRVFRLITGVPPCRYLTAMRLEQAKRRLATTPESVTDVSLDVGYNSLGTFTRRFTELVGVAPSRFRSLAHGEALAASIGRLFGRAAARTHEAEPPAGGLQGELVVPEDFRGAVFVGAFPSAIPQSRPAACAVLGASGSFRLTGLPDGEYHVLAAALPWAETSDRWLLYEEALRASLVGSPVVVQRGGAETRPRLDLHPPDLFDPPILMTFPALFAAHEAMAPGEGDVY